MSKHTLGPWKIRIDEKGYKTLISSDGNILMLVTYHDCETPSKYEDWLLIAAAPEMLEALRTATNSSGFLSMPSDTRELIYAAINKAEGRS